MNDVNGYDSTIKYAIMDIVGAINKIESMKQDRYLAMHPYSITHSADGYYRTYLPADDGKRKQIKKKSKSDLEKVVIDYWTKRSPTSFKERYAVWVDRQKLKGVSDNTIYKYQTDYVRFLKGKKIEKRDVRTIDEEYLELFFNELLSEKEVPYRALKALFGYLKGVFDKSIRDGLIESNPCLKIDLPLYKRRCEQAIVKMPEERTFSQSEKNRLINSLNKKRKERPDDVLPYAVELALYTGMRVGELSGLMWNDIDEVNKRIIIRHSEKLNRLTNTFYISTPKNGKTRIIEPAPFVMEVLKKHRADQQAQKKRAHDLWNEGEFPNLVFTHADGSHLNQWFVCRTFQSYLAKAGLPRHRMHDLRHTFAVNSIMAGDDIKTLQENMGHYSAAFTLDRYGHVTPTMRRESANRMQAFISNLTTESG